MPQLAETLQDSKLHFETDLPDGPLSYHWNILNISWATKSSTFLLEW